MAAIAIEPVTAAITAIVATAVEKCTEAAVMASISAAVTAAIEEAVSAAITEAIATVVASTVSGAITASTTKAVEEALKGLNEAVKDVIGSQGVNDIAQAITAIPSDEVVNKLAKAAIDVINPHLWVFQDPAFFRLTKLIKGLRAVKKGKKPEDDDDDDDCDEEKCRYFQGSAASDDAEDFIFFSVFGSAECKEGDEVFSMSAQWKKLKSLIDNPIGGHYVNRLFRELFDSCADEEEETDYSLVAGVQSLAVAAQGVKKETKKNKHKKVYVKVSYGNIVPFNNKQIYNIKGSSVDKRSSNWLRTYMQTGYGECSKCYIASEDPVCGHTDPLTGNIVGGHMWSPELKIADKSALYYILPICKRHNKRNVYDIPRSDGSGWLKTTADSFALQIKSVDKVSGWKGKYQALLGAKGILLLATEVDVEAGECHEITQPKHLTDWLVEEVHKIALEFAKDPIDIVYKEVSGIVLGKLNEIIKQAGNDAMNWAESEGNDIMLQSLIPFYGIYQAATRLTSLKSDAIGRFHSGAQSALTKYKDECLGQVEQARRKQRLNEETDKVIASKKWQDRIVAFEGTVSFNVSTLVTP